MNINIYIFITVCPKTCSLHVGSAPDKTDR